MANSIEGQGGNFNPLRSFKDQANEILREEGVSLSSEARSADAFIVLPGSSLQEAAQRLVEASTDTQLPFDHVN